MRLLFDEAKSAFIPEGERVICLRSWAKAKELLAVIEVAFFTIRVLIQHEREAINARFSESLGKKTIPVRTPEAPLAQAFISVMWSPESVYTRR